MAELICGNRNFNTNGLFERAHSLAKSYSVAFLILGRNLIGMQQRNFKTCPVCNKNFVVTCKGTFTIDGPRASRCAGSGLQIDTALNIRTLGTKEASAIPKSSSYYPQNSKK